MDDHKTTPLQKAIHQEKAFSLKERDLLDLLQHVNNPRDKAIIHLIFSLGCTIRELTNARAGDVHDDAIHLRKVPARTQDPPAQEPSRSGERIIMLDESAAQIVNALAEGKEPAEWLIEGRQGKQISCRRIEQVLAQASLKLPKRVTGKSLSRASKVLSMGEKGVDKAQEQELLEHAPTYRHELIIRLLLETGCTVSELVALRAADIDLEQGKVMIHAGFGKRAQDATIDISKTLASLVARHVNKHKLAPKDVIFSKRTNRNQGLSPLRIQQMLKQAGAQSGMRLTPRALRTTFILRKLEKGIPAREVCRIAGVKRLSI